MLSVRLRALATHALPSHFFCVVAGLGIGIGLGAVAGRWQAATPALPVVHAMTAQANETFAVCTTPLTTGLGGGAEGFFVLDFLTGDLSGGLLSPATGTFGVVYRHNVLNDLGFQPGQAKDPRFLLVAGQAELPRRGRMAMAPSVLYVTDCSSGATVAYGIPFGPQQGVAAGAALPLLPLDLAQPRGGGLQPPGGGTGGELQP